MAAGTLAIIDLIDALAAMGPSVIPAFSILQI